MSKLDEAVSTPPETPTEAPNSEKARRPRMLVPLVILVVIGSLVGFHYWQMASHEISTDDAFLAADITQVAPQVSGTVMKVFVEDNQLVHAGDLLVQLDDSTYRANVAQAEANLQAAVAQAQAAKISVSLTDLSGSAQLQTAQGGVDQAQGGIAGAQADASKAVAGVDSARAAAKAAQANVSSTVASIEAAKANRERAVAAVATAQAGVDTARATVKAAQAGVAAAQATADKAHRDAERYASLLDRGAVSKALADQAQAAERVADAQLESARQQVAIAEENIHARTADVKAAQQQVAAADAAIKQAQAVQDTAQQSATAAVSTIRQAEAQQRAAEENIRQAQARRQQAMGQLQQAKTKPTQVALSTSTQAQALARIAQAQAALDAARIQLNNARITASVDGMVSKRTVQVGNLVQPGTPLMALTQTNRLWVVANYKETQLAHIREGMSAAVVVDALDGTRLTGHVDSISAGTGATFALLPPDNATGNYTKVVQRVPIKITLDPNQPALARLRAGLSVEAIVLH